MTVKELIQLLQQFDPNLIVAIEDITGIYYEVNAEHVYETETRVEISNDDDESYRKVVLIR